MKRLLFVHPFADDNFKILYIHYSLIVDRSNYVAKFILEVLMYPRHENNVKADITDNKEPK